MATNCTRMIDVDRLFMADNVRTPECMSIPDMVASLQRHGYRNDRPLVVSDKGEKGFLVLIGNRRTSGLQWLHENDTPAFQVAVPNGKVPAVVHKGLTPEEEVDLRIDHSSDLDRVPLDEWSIFVAIKQMLQTETTQERIAVKLGLFKSTGKSKGQPRREYVQVRTNLARLPVYVQDELRKLTLNKDDTLIRWNHVSSLYKEYNDEYIKHPDGDGPKFQALWKRLNTPAEVVENEDGATRVPKELSPAEAIKRSQSASSPSLKQALLVVTRQSDADLAQIDAHLVEAESALITLTEIRNYLGEKDWGELLTISKAHFNAQEPEQVAEQIAAE